MAIYHQNYHEVCRLLALAEKPELRAINERLARFNAQSLIYWEDNQYHLFFFPLPEAVGKIFSPLLHQALGDNLAEAIKATPWLQNHLFDLQTK